MTRSSKIPILVGAAGLIFGMQAGWLARSLDLDGPWTTRESEDVLRVYLKGEPVGWFKYQYDHFKFAVTGPKTIAHKEVAGGSVGDDSLIFLHWEAMGVDSSKVWRWYDEDHRVEQDSYSYSERPQVAFPDFLLD